MEEFMNLYQSTQPELAIWTLYTSGRIANALVTISTVLFIWLSLRIAVQTRDRDDSNIVSKSLSSLFGVLVVYGTFIAWTINGGLITGTINGFKNVAEAGKSAGVELSESAVFFMDYYSNLSEPANTPSAPASLFLLVVLVMILGTIWIPKK